MSKEGKPKLVTNENYKPQPGDLVKLKSGSTLMTIAFVENDMARCVWFAIPEHRFKDEQIPVLCLVPASTIS